MSLPTNAGIVERSRTRLSLAVALLIGSMILGAAAINHTGYWYDETVSIGFITDSTAWYRISPEQMPGYYLLLRGWTDIVGLSEVAGRWLSLLLGLLTLALTWRLAASHFSRALAVFALAVLGSSAFFVRYYREMRPYTLLALCGTTSMWFFLEWMGRHRRRDAILYLVTSIAALYTHYFAGLVIAVQGLYLLWTIRPLRSRPRAQMNRFVGITFGLFVVIVLSMLPYVAFYLSGLEFVTSGRFSVFALTPAEALASSVLVLTNDSLALFLVLILLAVAARPGRIGLVLLWAFLPVAALLFVHTFIYKLFANPRYLLFVWPAFAILAAMGIRALGQRAALITTLVLIGIGAAQVVDDLPRRIPGVLNNPPWREMFSIAGQRTQSDSLVIVNMVNPVGFTGYRQPMLYYFNRYLSSSSLPDVLKPLPGTAELIELDFPPQPDPEVIASRAKQAHEVWWVATDGLSNTRGDKTRDVLRRVGYAECRAWNYPEYSSSLSYWARVSGETYQFENGMRLQKAPLNRLNDSYARGDTLEVALGLYTTAPIPIDYSLGIYLLDSAGRVVTQQDRAVADTRTSTWTLDTRYCDMRSLHLPDAPGQYKVMLALYDAIGGARIDTVPDSTPDKLITLLSLTLQ